MISPLALARVDLKRMPLSAETMTNWVPRVLGSMMIKPGLAFLGSTRNDSPSLSAEFIFGTDDTARLEFTDGAMRVWVNDVVVARPAVTSTFNDYSGGFNPGVMTASTFDDLTDVNRWQDNDESGGVSTFATGGYLSLLGNTVAAAIRDRSINVAGGNIGLEHALTIIVVRNSITIRLGSTLGGDEYLEDRVLRAGQHSIAITPSGPFFVRLSNTDDIAGLVDSVTINQAAGDMVLSTPWMTANLDDIRYDQSGDVVFVACANIAQKRIERQDRTNTPASRSWSVVDYAPTNGPFGTLNLGPTQLKMSVLTGDGTLTASRNFFKPTHVGALFRLTSAGQNVTQRIQSQNLFTNPIKVTGVGTTRNFTLKLEGPTFTATTKATLQRSLATPGTWEDVTTYTAVQTITFADGLDNQVVYYRLGVKTGEYTASDDLTASLIYTGGSINGIVRVTQYTDQQNVLASVLADLGAAAVYTSDWYEGDWSPRKGYPSGVALFDGRLWWAGKAFAWGSKANVFDGFDETEEGDATTIKRTLGSGPVDKCNWMLALNNLLIGTPGAVQVAKANSIDDPLTPTAFSLKPVTTYGCHPMRAIIVDTNGIYVARNGSKVYQLSADASLYTLVPYVPTELSSIIPEIGSPHFVRMAIQRSIDTRVHLVRADGKAAMIVFDKNENVTCWLMIETDGVIEDVCVLPGAGATPLEDQVYYTVARTIGGVTKRYTEKWALESQARGGTDTRISDSHVIYNGAPTVTIPVAHLEGKQVVVWADGVCPLDANGNPVLYTVTAGVITLSTAASYVVAGLPYTADWKMATMAYGSEAQAPLTQLKQINGVGAVMRDIHAKGVKFGQDFDHLTPLPTKEGGAPVDQNHVYDKYTLRKIEIDGTWDEDARVCVRAQAPLPCTMLALVFEGITHDDI